MKKVLIYIGSGIGLFAMAIMLKSCSGSQLIKVSTDKVQYRDIIETVSADGNIQPTTIVKISPDVPGQITELPVLEGQRVKKGDLLVKIFPDIYVSAYDQASASFSSSKAAITNAEAQLASSQGQYDNLKAVYERDQKLLSQGAIAQADFDAAKAQYMTAEANLKSAQDNIDAAKYNAKSSEENVNQAHDNLLKTSILSPIDGIVVGMLVKQGERVVGTAQMAGTEMMSVADLSNMEADVKVNENDIVNVKAGDTAFIEVDAFLNRKFKGLVTEVSNSANITGTSSVDQVTNFTVKIHILATSYADLMPAGTHDSPFKPGMSATADIQVKAAKHVLSTPIEAVTTRNAAKDSSSTSSKKDKSQTKDTKAAQHDTVQECVFVYANSSVKKINVTTGIQDANYIEIKTGLKENDEVVSEPFTAVSQALNDGTKVEKVDKSELFSSDK
jgi:HlyD family secretion protein